MLALTACTATEPEPAPTASDIGPEPTREPEELELLVPEPAAMLRSDWGSDPYARGSASFLAVGATTAHREILARSVDDRVFFAGEATSVGRPGTVAGARASGSRAASEVDLVATEGERIGVIGAGIAGAQAALELTRLGYDVRVIEARDRVGGRIDTRRDDDWPTAVELGPGTLDSGSAPELVEALDAAEVATLELPDSVEIRSIDGAVVEPSDVGPAAISRAVGEARSRFSGLVGDISLQSALTDIGAPGFDGAETDDDASTDDSNPDDSSPGNTSPDDTTPDGTTPEAPAPPPSDADRVDSAVRSTVGVAYGAEADVFSARYGFDDGDRTSDRVVVGGYSGLVDQMLDGIDVLTTSVVASVDYGDEGVSLRIGTGESQQVDRVIVTVPLGVLKNGDIEFSPPLPLSHTVATVALEMGTIDTIWLRFDEPFWSTDATRWSAVGGDLDVVDWINLEPTTGSAVLVGLVGGERALALAELGDDEVVARARVSLEPFLSA